MSNLREMIFRKRYHHEFVPLSLSSDGNAGCAGTVG